MVLIVLIVGYIAALMFKVIVHSSGKPTKTENVLVAVPRRAAGENTPIIRHSPNDQFVRRPALEVVPQWLQRPLDIFRMDLKGKWLAQVNLRGANADLANFEGPILAGADLQGANLRGAQFGASWLPGAKFSGAKLQGADFQRADLRGAQLQGADLRGVKNLTVQQIESAHTDERTLLPEYLKRPPP
jgi:Pentapeptide repeats (8 copies)